MWPPFLEEVIIFHPPHLSPLHTKDCFLINALFEELGLCMPHGCYMLFGDIMHLVKGFISTAILMFNLPIIDVCLHHAFSFPI